MIQRLWSTYKNDERGATAVEFSLIAMAFLVLVFGIMELGRYMFTWNAVQYAMEQATRYALVNEDAPIEEVEDYAASQMPPVLIDPDKLQIQISYSTTSDVDFIELSGNYDYDAFGPILPDGLSLVGDINVNARMPVP